MFRSWLSCNYKDTDPSLLDKSFHRELERACIALTSLSASTWFFRNPATRTRGNEKRPRRGGPCERHLSCSSATACWQIRPKMAGSQRWVLICYSLSYALPTSRFQDTRCQPMLSPPIQSISKPDIAYSNLSSSRCRVGVNVELLKPRLLRSNFACIERTYTGQKDGKQVHIVSVKSNR
jgi:hypothetical protein